MLEHVWGKNECTVVNSLLLTQLHIFINRRRFSGYKPFSEGPQVIAVSNLCKLSQNVVYVNPDAFLSSLNNDNLLVSVYDNDLLPPFNIYKVRNNWRYR